jgi:hypothetical protein
VSVTPEVLLAVGRKVLATQPFSRLLGEVAAMSPGKMDMQLGLKPAQGTIAKLPD